MAEPHAELGHKEQPDGWRGSGDPHDLPGFHALGADAHTSWLVIHQDLGSLQVWQPPALRARSSELPGAAMNVPDILSVLGALLTNMASLSHSRHLLSTGLVTSHHSTAGVRWQGTILNG